MITKHCKDCAQEIKPEELVSHTPRCLECRRAKARVWRAQNREDMIEYYKEYRKTEKFKEMTAKYKSSKAYKETYRAWAIKRLKEDASFKLCHNCSVIIRSYLKKNKLPKSGRTASYLGTTDYEFLKQHLESKFKPGMSWENWGKGEGKWNIDHIVPIASASNEEELVKLLHYTNLQPLWSEENIAKSSLHEGVRYISFTCRK